MYRLSYIVLTSSVVQVTKCHSILERHAPLTEFYRWLIKTFLIIRLRLLDFYEVIVNEAEGQTNYYHIEIEISMHDSWLGLHPRHQL